MLELQERLTMCEVSGYVYAQSCSDARLRFNTGAGVATWDIAHDDPARPVDARIYYIVDRVTEVDPALKACYPKGETSFHGFTSRLTG